MQQCYWLWTAFHLEFRFRLACHDHLNVVKKLIFEPAAHSSDFISLHSIYILDCCIFSLCETLSTFVQGKPAATNLCYPAYSLFSKADQIPTGFVPRWCFTVHTPSIHRTQFCCRALHSENKEKRNKVTVQNCDSNEHNFAAPKSVPGPLGHYTPLFHWRDVKSLVMKLLMLVHSLHSVTVFVCSCNSAGQQTSISRGWYLQQVSPTTSFFFMRGVQLINHETVDACTFLALCQCVCMLMDLVNRHINLKLCALDKSTTPSLFHEREWLWNCLCMDFCVCVIMS